jgi:hypothetical protein
MSKKQKKQISRSNGAVVAEKSAPNASTRVTERKPVSTFSPSSSSKSFMTTDFNPDYSYVVSDLKRIGILAASFIIALVVLSYFLH